ncbi:MAG TPA: porin [Usitatibacter sp.]|nr:porin [Usitatibacter sp.]
MRYKRLTLLCAIAVGSAALGYSGIAGAQSADEMKKQIDEMQRQIQMLRDRVEQMERQEKQKAAAPAPAPAPVAISPQQIAGHEFLERKPGDGITFFTRGGEVSVYGNLDVSVDSSTKGISGLTDGNGNHPPGNGGWMADISTNLSYIGVRGFQALPSTSARFVYQLETQLDVSVTPGAADTNSNTSGQVKSGLVSRNSYIGLADEWGAIKIGKSDAPYKNSTSRMNEFSGMWGDYSVIMGNTGGDNRTEFGTRLAHAIWYESPNMGGFTVNALFSPGQNRADDDSNIPAGEPECAGGNLPGSGALPVACNDGSFGNAYSVSASWESGPIYLTGAYEMHKKVNRTSDLPFYTSLDIADEDAFKVGIQWKFPTHTTVSAIWEDMKRHVDASLSDQNERQRSGYWFAVSQVLSDSDSVHFGWAHANKTPGDPGQHNPDNSQADANGFFPNVNNSANMYTVAWKHLVDKNFSWYLDYATTINERFAHYDLGAGGRAVTTDCHDASNPDQSGFDPNGGAPHCYTGGKLQGVSVGMKYRF